MVVFSKDSSNPIPRILIVGYGKIGADLYGYLGIVPELVDIVGVVEPYKDHKQLKSRIRQPIYTTLEDALNELEPNIVIDCSPPGQGVKNLEVYRRYNVPAIIQGGERQDAAPLYIPGKLESRIVRMPKCSATITNWILMSLLREGIMPRYLEGEYYKVMPKVDEGKGWWEPEYISCMEVEQVWMVIANSQLRVGHISSRYLPGEVYNRPIYSGSLLLQIPDLSESTILKTLERSEYVLVLPSKELNEMPLLNISKVPSIHKIPLAYLGMPLIPVIDGGSIRRIHNTNMVRLHVEAVAPPIDLPLNLMAVLEIINPKATQIGYFA